MRKQPAIILLLLLPILMFFIGKCSKNCPECKIETKVVHDTIHYPVKVPFPEKIYQTLVKRVGVLTPAQRDSLIVELDALLAQIDSNSIAYTKLQSELLLAQQTAPGKTVTPTPPVISETYMEDSIIRENYKLRWRMKYWGKINEFIPEVTVFQPAPQKTKKNFLGFTAGVYAQADGKFDVPVGLIYESGSTGVGLEYFHFNKAVSAKGIYRFPFLNKK